MRANKGAIKRCQAQTSGLHRPCCTSIVPSTLPTFELKLALPNRMRLNLSSVQLAVMFFIILSIVWTATRDTPGSCGNHSAERGRSSGRRGQREHEKNFVRRKAFSGHKSTQTEMFVGIYQRTSLNHKTTPRTCGGLYSRDDDGQSAKRLFDCPNLPAPVRHPGAPRP